MPVAGTTQSGGRRRPNGATLRGSCTVRTSRTGSARFTLIGASDDAAGHRQIARELAEYLKDRQSATRVGSPLALGARVLTMMVGRPAL
jgi:hypothetical protein